MHLLVGGGEQSEEQVGERDRVDEPLDPLDGGALSHDGELGRGPVTGPALGRTEGLEGNGASLGTSRTSCPSTVLFDACLVLSVCWAEGFHLLH